MCELSRLHAMAGPTTLTPFEIELACHLIAGRPITRPTVRVFGRGYAHACGMAAFDFTPPDGLEPAVRARVRELAIETMERAAIITPPFELPRHGIARPSDVYGENYAATERASAARLEQEGLSKDLVRRFVSATEFLDIQKPLNEVLGRHGLSFQDVARDQDGATNFLTSMPTRWMTAHLRRAAFENRSNRWDAHDLNDIAYLAIAAVHCNVVVTERKWANYFKRLDIEVPALIMTDLDALSAVVVSA